MTQNSKSEIDLCFGMGAPNPKFDNKGVTLIELLIAISLLTLILFAGSGIYLSGWNMFRDAQHIAQAQRNAMVPMMHMVKNIQKSGSQCFVTRFVTHGGTELKGTELRFRVYDPSFITRPIIGHQYLFGNNQITFDPQYRYMLWSQSGQVQIIGRNILNCTFTSLYTDTNGTVIEITITATDNNGNNPYTLITRATARCTGIEPVYTALGTIPA